MKSHYLQQHGWSKGYYNEWNKSEKEKCHMISDFKKQNQQTSRTETHSWYREHFDGCQTGGGIGEMCEKGEGITKYKLVVTEVTKM